MYPSDLWQLLICWALGPALGIVIAYAAWRGSVKSVAKRILVWLAESLSEIAFTGALILAIARIQFRGENLRNGGLAHDLLVASAAVGMMFFLTGYLLTTLIGRLFSNPENRWLYPSIASALYVVHFEILSIGVGGAFDPWERWLIRVVGACIAFTCTLGGNQVLHRWKPTPPLVQPV
jgi:hypothetical protein